MNKSIKEFKAGCKNCKELIADKGINYAINFYSEKFNSMKMNGTSKKHEELIIQYWLRPAMSESGST